MLDSCCSATNSASFNAGCCQKSTLLDPITLLVVSLLCLGWTVKSFYAPWSFQANKIVNVLVAGTSLVTTVLLFKSLFCSSPNTDQATNTSSTPIQGTNENHDLSQWTDEQLVTGYVPISQEQTLLSSAVRIELLARMKNKWRHIDEGVVAVALQFQPFFTQLPDEKYGPLIGNIVAAADEEFPTLTIAQVFEKIECRNNELKDSLLSEKLSNFMTSRKLIYLDRDEVVDPQVGQANSFVVNTIVLRRNLIKKDLDPKESIKLPKPLIEGIRVAIARLVSGELKNLKDKKNNYTIREHYPVGFRVTLGRVVSVDMVAPLLPIFESFPGLVSFDLSNLHEGLGDESFDTLLEICNANCYLIDFRVNTQKMNEFMQEAFTSAVDLMLRSRKFQKPPVDELLKLLPEDSSSR